MRWLYGLQARLRAIFGATRTDDDIDGELSFHLAMQTRQNIDRGMSEEDARRRARMSLGGVTQTTEARRDVEPLQGLRTFLQDVRYAARLMRRSPAFTLVAVLTVALGVGANTAIFSVVHGVLLKPLPYTDPDALLRVFEELPPDTPEFPVSPATFLEYRAQARTFEALAAFERADLQLGGERSAPGPARRRPVRTMSR